MPVRDSAQGFGWGTIVLHWLLALTTLGLFALGVWMTGLSYYDRWYNDATRIHEAVGLMLFDVLVLGLLWRLLNRRPDSVPGTPGWQVWASRSVHLAMVALVALVIVTGYLVSTADGRSVDVFGLVTVPALWTSIEDQADRAGALHWWLACALVALAALHAAAALKHHFLNRDETLRRMLRPTRSTASHNEELP